MLTMGDKAILMIKCGNTIPLIKDKTILLLQDNTMLQNDTILMTEDNFS